jgi:hypothetical protein
MIIYDDIDYLPAALRAAGIAASGSKQRVINYLNSIEAKPRSAPAWSHWTLQNTWTRYGLRPVSRHPDSASFWQKEKERLLREKLS